MKRTIFTTPGISWLCHVLARGAFWLSGWKVEGPTPEGSKYVLIGAPHSSNWDFICMLGTVFVRRMDVRWMGKHTLFPYGLGWFMKWLGGISVNRKQAGDVVGQVVQQCNESDSFRLIVTPEGTRKKVDRWKTGFYRIASQADIPLYLGTVDYSNKVIRFLGTFDVTGDLEQDLPKIIQRFPERV